MVSLLAVIGVKPVFAMEHILKHIPQAQEVGEARMSVMLWDIYDAELFAPNGIWNEQNPFALQLTYLRDLKGAKIADRSVQEMRFQGFNDEIKLATWHTQMRRIFPDVGNGDSLTGIHAKDGQTIFYNGNAEIGRIKDPEFGKYFFSIWLSPKTSAPDIRQSLLGQGVMKGQEIDETIKRTISYGTNGVH